MTKSRKIGALSIRPQVKQGKETGKWFLDIPETLAADGKRKRLLYPSRTAAEGIARELKQMFETRKLGYSEAAPKRGLPFSEAVDRFPSASEVVQLLDHLRPSVRVLVWLMAETGLRPSEAQNLPWAHVDAKRGSVIVKPFGDHDPKNESSHRSVFPSPELMRELLRLSRTGDYVFPGTDPSKPIKNVRTALKTAAKKAGLTYDGKPFIPTVKLFRKAFATTLAERGVNQSIVGAMMGHAPGSRMTAQYYQFIDDDAKRSNRLSLHDIASRGVA